ncbi:MAG: diacylglycerol kinase family lipid kinase [Oscillospiraceae bacterium]|nr:diacylglycerol kinase family lipid kinase [Oscillospiraceae bacterium]
MKQIKNLFIVNPNAGTKQAKNHLPKILDLFGGDGGVNSVHLTNSRGDAAKIAAELGSLADRIICVGGDGTFNEVVTGLQNSGLDIPIGYIPAGTANDLASSLKISKNMTQAAKDIIASENIINLDIGRFNGNYFAYIASFGAFTKVSYTTPQSSKNMLGHFAYIIEGVKELPAIRPEYIKIEIFNPDGGVRIIEGEYVFGAFSNSKSVGGVLTLDPDIVDMTDGIFEVLLIKPLNGAQAVWDCVYSLINQDYNCGHIDFFSVRNAVIYADPKMNWTLDGEYFGGCEKITLENLNNAVRVFV